MRSILIATAVMLLSWGAHAQSTPPDEDHAAHHPEGASAPGSAPQKASPKPKGNGDQQKARPAVAAPAAPAAPPASAPARSGMGMGMGMGGSDMQKMREEMHKPGGMHDQMHGKDAKMMPGGAMGAMPAASAAGK